ncbi:MAG TPA: acetamidase, partial [Opitutaceae bacterium]|nr:acetamidase [Opitutaceae bacterium]
MLTSSRLKFAAIAILLVALPSAPSAAVIKPDYHLPSTPETIGGWWSAETPPVLKIKSGQIVEIDTICLFGMSDDKPEQFFIDNGISMDLPVVKDMLAIKKAVTNNPKFTGTPVNLTGPIYVEGALPGDTLEVRILDIKS